jgi:hypothetical protein
MISSFDQLEGKGARRAEVEKEDLWTQKFLSASA